MRENCYRIYFRWKRRNNLPKGRWSSKIQFVNKFKFVYIKNFLESLCCLLCPLCGTGYKEIQRDMFVMQSDCHLRRIFFTTLVQWSVKIRHRWIVPTAFCMTY